MNRQPRILLYGFGPYRPFKENITAKVIGALPAVPGVRSIVFPVRFDRGQFTHALERCRPDMVLGLGQSTRQTMQLEARAANRRRGGKNVRVRPIRQGGPRWLPATLEINRVGGMELSDNAGDYVCNFSMYILLEQIRRTGARIQFGFVHIPHDFSLSKASRAVAAILRQWRRKRIIAERVRLIGWVCAPWLAG